MIDFEALLPVVRRIDELRFGTLLAPDERLELESLKLKFVEITNGRGLPPRRFVSDGCTFSTDKFGYHCCEIHDLRYWLGGTRAERLEADAGLRDCTVKRSAAYAPIQFMGVRVFGHPLVPDFPCKRYRWNHGWNDWPKMVTGDGTRY